MAKEKTATADTTATELMLFSTLLGCELEDDVIVISARSGGACRRWAVTLRYALELRDELSRCLREACVSNVVVSLRPKH